MIPRAWIRTETARRSRRGGALIASLIIVLFLATIAMAAFSMSLAQKEETGRASDELEALYLADAGVSESLARLAAARRRRLPPPANVGSQAVPHRLRRGYFWAEVEERPDQTFRVTSTGSTRGASRRLEAIIAPSVSDVFEHAIFAGNSSGDTDYTLRISGVGADADHVNGDVYSGNDVTVDEDATIDGSTLAQGTITGTPGTEGVMLPIPDIAGMNYAVNHDVDVAGAFDSAGVLRSSSLGGDAWELPEDDPAHVFRKNPDDRVVETASTDKDDYFLEDPYETLDSGDEADGSDASEITLSGFDGAPGTGGNSAVYFVDGNLWLHNAKTLTFKIGHSVPTGVQVTFVVKGNIYFSDNLVYEAPDVDGVAFIAIRDEAVADSGNIYFGDPRYGTLERMHAFMYAENDFYDNNLDASGSATVELQGNMTAGNHVSILRDFVNALGDIVHSKLTVDFDDRLATGELVLPGLPRTRDERTAGLRVVLWREVARQ